MQIERRRSKGSFLSLFDCNGVYRKKLFPATPCLTDELKQAKENVGNMPESQLNTAKMDENGTNPSRTENCDFNCELPAGSDMRYETKIKVPCLVARLMGLDSLPASTVNKTENRTIEARLQKITTLRDLELKQKPEASDLASVHEKIMYLNTVEGSRYSEAYHHHHGNRGNSNLLAVQANKAHVQCTGTLTSNGNRGHRQRQQNEIDSNQFFRSQKPILQQAMKQRTCTARNRHYNELEQNSAAIKVRPNSSSRRRTGAKDEFSQIKTKSKSMRKRYPERHVLSANNVVDSYEGKSIKCNVTTERSMNQDTLNKKAGKDVISFTFTSPLKKESQPSNQTNNVHDVNNAPGLHMIDGDFSSDLLRINSPECTTLATRLSSSAVLPPSEVIRVQSREGDTGFQSDLMLNMNKQLQGSKTMRQHSSDNNIETEYCHQGYNRPRKLKLEHVNDNMLSCEKLMEESLAEDETNRNEHVIKTNVLEKYWSSETESDGEEDLKVERNLLFDFVGEFLELRRSKRYNKGRALESQIRWEEELCIEIKRFKSMQEIMVDELVNIDMSSSLSDTWLHFQTQHFQQSLLSEIEWDISTSLINDLLLDLMHH